MTSAAQFTLGRGPRSRLEQIMGMFPVWAREVGDCLRECRVQKLERSLPRCLGACWVVNLGAAFVHECVVRLVAIDLELRFRLLERALQVVHLGGCCTSRHCSRSGKSGEF